MLLVLDKEFHKLAKLVPTKGVERSLSTIIGFPVVKWDLGGQVQYREQYLTTRTETILSADVVVQVVDVQDWDNYEEALKYYENVLKIIKENEENPFILICLHKTDPEIYDKYKDHVKDLITRFEAASKGWNFSIYVTSIYNRRSVIEAFSFGISQFLPKKKSMDLVLKNFIADAKESGEKVSGVMLWDQNSVFLSMIFDGKKTESASLTASMGILSLMENFEQSGTFERLTLEVNREFQFLARKVGKLYTTIVGMNLDFDKVWNLYDRNYLTSLEEIIEKEE